jgi:hypothetical protein
MNGFATKTGQQHKRQPDPTKHVNYVLGMVLGVDDFTQEFAYLAGQDQWLARVLLGYGTVCGLRVSVEPDAKGPRVEVASGTALTPRGQLVHVPAAQCASLNDWLAVARNREELVARLDSPPGDEISLFVVLCYRECPTDMIPIPGEPCRSEDDSMAPSRVQDDFRLELRFTPPEQREEDALRDFVEWLRQIEIVDGVGSFATLDEFLDAVRTAAHLPGSPPNSPPDFMFGSPPAGLRIPAAAACAYLRAAFRIWVTELRPLWLGAGQTCRTPPDEACVLLAELNVPLVQVALSGEWRVDDSRQVDINEERRPYLLPLRLLQEWVLCGRLTGESSGGGGVLGPTPADVVVAETTFGQPATAGVSLDYSRADHTHGTPPLPPIPTPPTPADTVIAEVSPGQAPTAGVATEYSRADHTHGTPPLPPIPTPPVPANTVVAETTAGQAPAAGVALEYSRADHTHGTPPLPPIPTPADTVAPETAFGRVASAGVSQQYSRADHTHGTPPAPATATDVVERPPGLSRYLIVAAGIVRGDGTNRPPVYNRLEARVAGNGLILIRFAGYRRPDGFQYIVKALPVTNTQFPFFPVIVFNQFTDEGFLLQVFQNNEPIAPERLRLVELMIEVSQFFRPEA